MQTLKYVAIQDTKAHRPLQRRAFSRSRGQFTVRGPSVNKNHKIQPTYHLKFTCWPAESVRCPPPPPLVPIQSLRPHLWHGESCDTTRHSALSTRCPAVSFRSSTRTLPRTRALCLYSRSLLRFVALNTKIPSRNM